MVATYTIFGAKVGSHWLSMATLGTVFGSVYFATRGPKKTGAANTPPINASSKDEENFIQEFLKSADGGSKAH